MFIKKDHRHSQTRRKGEGKQTECMMMIIMWVLLFLLLHSLLPLFSLATTCVGDLSLSLLSPLPPFLVSLCVQTGGIYKKITENWALASLLVASIPVSFASAFVASSSSPFCPPSPRMFMWTHTETKKDHHHYRADGAHDFLIFVPTGPLNERRRKKQIPGL